MIYIYFTYRKFSIRKNINKVLIKVLLLILINSLAFLRHLNFYLWFVFQNISFFITLNKFNPNENKQLASYNKDKCNKK